MSDAVMADRRNANVKGIALMTLGMALVVVLDSIAKYAGGFTNPTWVLTGIGMGTFLGFMFGVLRSGQAIFSPAILHPVVLVRSAGDATGSFFIILALSLVPLSLVTVIMQTIPLLITLGAALFLRERVDGGQWLALIVGFAGAVMIVQPGASGFDAAVIIAVLSAVGFAVRDLASRAAPKSVSTFQLGSWGGLALMLTGLILSFAQGNPPPPPTAHTLIVFLAILVVATSALFCITAAMRVGDVGVVAPFRYTRLLFGIALGIAIFDENLDILTLIGGIIIVASGLFVWWRERQRDKDA